MIKNYEEFCRALLGCGFSMGGGSDKGIFALIPYDWQEQQYIDTPVKWHTGDPDTDPWEWRMRVLEERDDIAYSKVFFRSSGYITRDWYGDFVAVRRGGEVFEEAYFNGRLSREAKRIYEAVSLNGAAALHDIKRIGGFLREENSRFERALVELQMKLYITMCGRAQRVNSAGEGYGWSSTVFMTAEDFWEQRGVSLKVPDPLSAYERIEAQALRLNPQADKKKLKKFILG